MCHIWPINVCTPCVHSLQYRGYHLVLNRPTWLRLRRRHKCYREPFTLLCLSCYSYSNQQRCYCDDDEKQFRSNFDLITTGSLCKTADTRYKTHGPNFPSRGSQWLGGRLAETINNACVVIIDTITPVVLHNCCCWQHYTPRFIIVTSSRVFTWKFYWNRIIPNGKYFVQVNIFSFFNLSAYSTMLDLNSCYYVLNNVKKIL